MTEDVRVCFDRVLPLTLGEEAMKRAVAENPTNRRSPLEATLDVAKQWRPGRTLRIRFIDGDSKVQAQVERYAREWCRYANISFAFGNDPGAEIRISFRERGSWSALGTDALVEDYYPKDQPTMNFGWLTSKSAERDFSVVLHEFGHALGMIHEHQNPTAAIKWNRKAIYQALAGPPNEWDQDTVDRNFFELYDYITTQFTRFDEKSIMIYAIPREWTLDGRVFVENDRLSETDKAFIAQRYP